MKHYDSRKEEILNEWLPYALNIHVPYETFWGLNPTTLNPFQKAYENEKKLLDEQAWLQGLYTYRGVMAAIDHAFNGKKAQTEYPEKPFIALAGEKDREMTEEEMERNHRAVFAYLGVMKTNFEIQHPEKKHITTESEVVTHG